MSDLSITFRGKTIDINSGLLEVFLRFASLHIEVPTDEVGTEIRNDWLFISSGGHSEILSPDFDLYLNSDVGISVAVSALRSALASFERGPKYIDHSHLNLLWAGERFTSGIDSEKMIKVGRSLLSIIC